MDIFSVKNTTKISTFAEKPFENLWIVYGKTISNAFENALKQEKSDILAHWMLDDYKVLLLEVKNSQRMISLTHEYQYDFAKLASIPNLNEPGLALFDMDSTAIEIECIDEIAKLANIGEEVSKITEQAMRGELDFAQSLQKRVEKLEGFNEEILSQIKLPLTSGMKKLCATLQHFGWHVAIASGGFTHFSNQLKDSLSLSYAEANQLEIKNNRLTGKLVGNIVDANRKADILTELAAKYHLPISQTIAVGDGANDLPMMARASLGIAYKAKPAVEKQAQIAIRHSDLVGIFCVLSASLLLNFEDQKLKSQ